MESNFTSVVNETMQPLNKAETYILPLLLMHLEPTRIRDKTIRQITSDMKNLNDLQKAHLLDTHDRSLDIWGKTNELLATSQLGHAICCWERIGNYVKQKLVHLSITEEELFPGFKWHDLLRPRLLILKENALFDLKPELDEKLQRTEAQQDRVSMVILKRKRKRGPDGTKWDTNLRCKETFHHFSWIINWSLCHALLSNDNDVDSYEVASFSISVATYKKVKPLLFLLYSAAQLQVKVMTIFNTIRNAKYTLIDTTKLQPLFEDYNQFKNSEEMNCTCRQVCNDASILSDIRRLHKLARMLIGHDKTYNQFKQ